LRRASLAALYIPALNGGVFRAARIKVQIHTYSPQVWFSKQAASRFSGTLRARLLKESD
jgi:hypothetical protein